MIKHINLARTILIPFMLKNKLKMGITVFGIALGVGVFIAVQTASLSVRQSMKSLINLMSSSEADIQITLGRTGFPEDILSKVSTQKGIKTAYPIVINRTRIEINNKQQSIFVFGIDITKRHMSINSKSSAGSDIDVGFDIEGFLAYPNSIVVSRKFLDDNGLTKANKIRIFTARGLIDCIIKGVIEDADSGLSSGNIIFMSIFAAQYLFKKEGKLDRIDIELSDGVKIDDSIGLLTRKLGNIVRIQRRKGGVNRFGSLYKSFDLNLSVVSFIALFVGMYLIINTISTSISQQKKEIGILRSFGAQRKDIVILFLIKGFVIGFAGSVLGLILGYVLSYFSIAAFKYSIIYSSLLEGSSFSVSFFVLVIAFIFGLIVCLIASLVPILISFRNMPAYNMRPYAYKEHRTSLNINMLLYTGIILLILAYISSRQDVVFEMPLFGFLANFLIILGFSFIIPWLIETKVKVINRYYFRSIFTRFKMGFEAYLGIENTRGISLGKSAVSSATLMISIALIINISILIESYYYSINKWFNSVNNADISIVSGSSYSQGDIFPMEHNRIATVDKEYIKDIDYYRFVTASYKGTSLDIHSFKLDVAKRNVDYTFTEGNKRKAFYEMDKSDGVLISYNMASKFNLSLGARFYLNVGDYKAKGPFLVSGIVMNYLSSSGIVSIPRKTFIKHFNDDKVDIFKIYLKDKSFIKEFRAKFYKTVQNANSLIFSTIGEFKDRVLEAIDDTFFMFHVLSFITAFIAIMGIINALLSSIIDRNREIGILKALGASKAQIVRIITSQALFIGFFSAILGIISGFLLSFVSVFIINKETVGWHLEYSFSLGFILFIFALFSFISFFAGYYPAYKASSVVVRTALEYE